MNQSPGRCPTTWRWGAFQVGMDKLKSVDHSLCNRKCATGSVQQQVCKQMLHKQKTKTVVQYGFSDEDQPVFAMCRWQKIAVPRSLEQGPRGSHLLFRTHHSPSNISRSPIFPTVLLLRRVSRSQSPSSMRHAPITARKAFQSARKHPKAYKERSLPSKPAMTFQRLLGRTPG